MSLILSLLLSTAIHAQKVGVKVDDATAGAEDTTITIQKGKPTAPGEAKFEITEGTDELQGDPAPLQKEARTNWKKACDEWKKEFKDTNKESGTSILSMSCGQPTCATSSMETVCKSTSKHKLKVRVN